MRTPRLASLAFAALAAAGCAAPAREEAPAPSRAPLPPDGRVERRRGPVARLEAPAPVPAPTDPVLFPEGPNLYEPYMAAQRQSRTAVKVIRPFGRTDNTRIEASIGLDRSLARWRSEGDPDAATEVGFEAGVFARFDLHEEYDMEATDWRFGIPLVRRDGDLAWKVHLSHRTSHLGDEFMERTGATPVHYHMEEAAAGVSWDASAGSRVYGEAGAALYTGGPAANGRVQSGYEWVGSKGRLGLSPWLALDLEARNEQDWNPNATLAAGVALGRSARLGFEYYRGRDPQTQFLEDRMQWVALALTFDY